MMKMTNYLDRLLEPVTSAFTPEVAKRIADLRIEKELEIRIGELRTKANAGTLTPAEDAEYKEFVEAIDVVSIIQSKARQFLTAL